VKIEKKESYRIDRRWNLDTYTDIEADEVRFEADGQTVVNLQGPAGVQQAPVTFHFGIEAEGLVEACEGFQEALKAAAEEAVKKFLEQLNSTAKKIQLPGGGIPKDLEDQIIQLRKDRFRNGKL